MAPEYSLAASARLEAASAAMAARRVSRTSWAAASSLRNAVRKGAQSRKLEGTVQTTTAGEAIRAASRMAERFFRKERWAVRRRGSSGAMRPRREMGSSLRQTSRSIRAGKRRLKAATKSWERRVREKTAMVRARRELWFQLPKPEAGP